MNKREYFQDEKTPCRAHRCDAPCCEDYEVRLLESDIERLMKAGYPEERFVEYEDNYAYLRRNEQGCVFLKKGACSVHPYRPLACRTFPWILSDKRVKTDDFCPYHKEFSPDPELQERLEKLIEQQEKERLERNICLIHSCHTCCLDTEMPLTNADVERILDLGYRDFFVEGNGGLTLRNIDHRCFFLGESGKCRIYENRPEGCGFYPFVLGRDKAVIDEDCPYGDEFRRRFDPGIEDGLKELVERIEKEKCRVVD